jgi:hypothetical protein
MKNKIKPTYVTFEQAKWLKEKGFDVPCKQRFWVGFENEEHFQDDCISNNWNNYDDSSTVYYSAPEQHVVVEWLRVNHGIWVQVSILKDYEWHYSIRRKENNWNIEFPTKGTFNSPQEAYLGAFDYIRENIRL